MMPRFLGVTALLLTVLPCGAAVELAPLFQNGAVLQRDRPLPVWGLATPNSQVTAEFAGQKATATADKNGRWKLTLPVQAASAEGRTLTVTEAGAPPVEVKDVLVGEVWLASGQSNMEFRVGQTRPEDQQLAATPTTATLRLFQVPHIVSPNRQDKVPGRWSPATPETVKGFSAVAYFFGRGLSEDIKVPVGLIESNWGGSRIEPWWAEEGLAGIPEYAEQVKRRRASLPGYPEYDQAFRGYLKTLRDWTTTAEQAMDAGKTAPEAPKAPALLNVGSGGETGTYQAMIHPLVPYALRGFLWYQGESNNGDAMAYTTKMQALIDGWRKQFDNKDAPFLFVQIAPYGYGADRTFSLPQLWSAQQAVLAKVPHTGMAVTNDVGNPKDIHPTNKSDVAYRLLQWALADVYGKKGVVRSGPLYSGYKIEGGNIRVTFSETGSGLITRDGKDPDWFEVAGDDGNFVQAEAKIAPDGKSVLVHSDKVATPFQVRFAWSQIAEPNLMNKEKLPAGGFNSHWPVDPTLGELVSVGRPYQSSDANNKGWNAGLTDGTWGNTAGTCYATNETPQFPKTVTIDLGVQRPVQAIRYGVPNIGATKTVAVSVSTDGKNFTEVGRNAFAAKTAGASTARFAATPARFVRATIEDHYPQQDGFDPNFAFLSEVEVYSQAAH
ncbi:discoidin domain-containing protein [Luteolibacter ambystomatis]|uniref:Discoidin domain-containing protein n=1 Tax=Luteolibacter ambystomatis TaxID=2824561 RepID=A0A975PG29_9BACT|nr:sialate O-acetylesterase [Luteolibacter ambystomatis]QUE52403.1 discoidin domain-containing protein [Luteolibacter ambystomatis]